MKYKSAGGKDCMVEGKSCDTNENQEITCFAENLKIIKELQNGHLSTLIAVSWRNGFSVETYNPQRITKFLKIAFTFFTSLIII